MSIAAAVVMALVVGALGFFVGLCGDIQAQKPAPVDSCQHDMGLWHEWGTCKAGIVQARDCKICNWRETRASQHGGLP